MRVVVLTHYYPPESGAPQARLEALAAGLVGRGWDVTVHTGFPHYPTGRIASPHRNRPLAREMGRGGERIVRSAVLAAPNVGFSRRLLDHLSLAVTALATAPASGPADVVLVESPPLFTAVAGVLYAALKRAPLVVNVADRWPASAVELGALSNRGAVRAAEALERFIYARAAAITVPTEGLLRDLGALPVAAGRVVRIPPAVDVSRFADVPEPPGGGPLQVLYAGTVGLAHGIETLLEGARRAGPDVVQVTVAGGGAEAVRLASDSPGNVRSIGIVPPAAVPALYGRAHAGVVLLRDRPILAGALPTKLLECMAAGRPAVLSARGEAAALIRASGAGIAVAPEDPDAVAMAFGRLQRDPALRMRLGAAGRTAVEAEYDRPRSTGRWADTLERAARRHGQRQGAAYR